MKKGIFIKIGLIFVCIIGAAFYFDSRRMLTAARQDLIAADAEIRKQELRYLQFAKENLTLWRAAESKLAAYESAAALASRQEEFQELSSAVQQAAAALDPSNTAQRRTLDELSGALNRRQIALQRFEESFAYCSSLDTTLRARIAPMPPCGQVSAAFGSN